MKFIKVYYRVTDEIDTECLDACIGDKERIMCGSTACQRCEFCFGHGREHALFLGRSKRDGSRGLMVFEQGWIYCMKTYVDVNFEMLIRRCIYATKVFFKVLFEEISWKIWKWKRRTSWSLKGLFRRS